MPQQLTTIRSPDLFENDKQQVFSAKTGEYLGLVKEGEQLPLTPKEQEAQEQANKQQLSLF